MCSAPISFQEGCRSRAATNALENESNRFLKEAGGKEQGPPILFFPDDAIKTVMTRETVKNILECSCLRCMSFARALSKDCYKDRTRYLTSILSQATKLFAVLTAIGYPSLIGGFAYYDQMDDNFWGKRRSLRKILRKNIDSQIVDDIVETFREKSRQFRTPTLTNDHFVKFPPGTVLPFYNTEKVGQGAFGSVYSFRICTGYGDFGDTNNHSDVVSCSNLRDKCTLTLYKRCMQEKRWR